MFQVKHLENVRVVASLLAICPFHAEEYVRCVFQLDRSETVGHRLQPRRDSAATADGAAVVRRW